MDPLHLRSLHLAGPVVGKPHRRVALGVPERRHQLVGRIEMDMAMDVDREPFAARMRRTGEPAGDAGAGRQTGEQHSILHDGPAGWRRRSQVSMAAGAKNRKTGTATLAAQA